MKLTKQHIKLVKGRWQVTNYDITSGNSYHLWYIRANRFCMQLNRQTVQPL